jgi:prepilin-type N-terminal cleavage/methylation domain-containing protein
MRRRPFQSGVAGGASSARHRRGACRRAVSLLEVVLAVAILGVVMSMTYWFYQSSLETRSRVTEMSRKLQLARITAERIGEEIRQASKITTEGRLGIVGGANDIKIITLRLPGKEVADDKLWRDWIQEDENVFPHQYDFVEIDYHIARHPEIQHDEGYDMPLGLVRKEKVLPLKQVEQGGAVYDEIDLGGEGGDVALIEADDESTAEDTEVLTAEDIRWNELYTQELVQLRFCYFDGLKWWDSWEVPGENPLPQLVMITLGFEPRVPFGDEFGLQEEEEFCTCLNEDPETCEPLPDGMYQLVVRVPQADRMFRSRVTRETQALAEELTGGEGEEDDTGF